MALVSQAPATLWILYGQDRFGWSMMVAGLSLAGYGTCHALSQAFAIGPLVARFGERKALLIGLAADAVGLALLSVATRGWAPFALLPFFAAGGMALPALQALMAHKVDDDHQGELQGTLASMGSLIGVAGPLVATALYAATRDVWPGLVCVGRRPVPGGAAAAGTLTRQGCGAITLPFFHFRKQKPAFCRRSKLTYANPV